MLSFAISKLLIPIKIINFLSAKGQIKKYLREGLTNDNADFSKSSPPIGISRERRCHLTIKTFSAASPRHQRRFKSHMTDLLPYLFLISIPGVRRRTGPSLKTCTSYT